jgi:hypothetical protein
MIALAACTKSEATKDSPANPPPDQKLTGYWEAQDTRTFDDNRLPYRMRFFVNSNGMQELQVCSANGARGFTAWSNPNGPHQFEILIDPSANTSFKGTITRLDESGLQLNGKYEYRRMAVQPTTPALATDADNSLCTM